MRGIQERQVSPRTSRCSKRNSQSRSTTPPSKTVANRRSRSTADQDAARCLRAIGIAETGIACRRLLHGHGALEGRLSAGPELEGEPPQAAKASGKSRIAFVHRFLRSEWNVRARR